MAVSGYSAHRSRLKTILRRTMRLVAIDHDGVKFKVAGKQSGRLQSARRCDSITYSCFTSPDYLARTRFVAELSKPLARFVAGELFMGRRPTRARMKILQAQLYSMNASAILSRPIENPSAPTAEGGGLLTRG
jgi:hypothetical protein